MEDVYLTIRDKNSGQEVQNHSFIGFMVYFIYPLVVSQSSKKDDWVKMQKILYLIKENVSDNLLMTNLFYSYVFSRAEEEIEKIIKALENEDLVIEF